MQAAPAPWQRDREGRQLRGRPARVEEEAALPRPCRKVNQQAAPPRRPPRRPPRGPAGEHPLQPSNVEVRRATPLPPEQASLFQRERVAAQLCRPGYLAKLLELFRVAEDLEDERSLPALYAVMKGGERGERGALLGMLFTAGACRENLKENVEICRAMSS